MRVKTLSGAPGTLWDWGSSLSTFELYGSEYFLQ